MATSLLFLVKQVKGNLGITESKENMFLAGWLGMILYFYSFFIFYCAFLKKLSIEVFPVTANLEFLTFSGLNLLSNLV